MPSKLQVIIFTDEPQTQGGWHGAQLAAALAARGAQAVFVSLKDCLLDLSANTPNIQISNNKNLPAAAIVRGIAGGTLQQITQRLTMLHALHLQGAVVYNDAKAIERTVDKAMTSFLLLQNGVATPKTWVCESRQKAHEIIAETAQLVIKPLFGSQGQGVRLVEDKKPPLPMDNFVDGVFYLQQWIKATHDYRVFVVNNQAIAAMQRTGKTWLHNVAQGATCKNILDKHTEQDVLETALQGARVLGMPYCGVDVIRDAQGQLYVLEINSIPAWRGLQTVSNINIAQVLADDVLSKV